MFSVFPAIMPPIGIRKKMTIQGIGKEVWSRPIQSVRQEQRKSRNRHINFQQFNESTQKCKLKEASMVHF